MAFYKPGMNLQQNWQALHNSSFEVQILYYEELDFLFKKNFGQSLFFALETNDEARDSACHHLQQILGNSFLS